MIEDRIEKIRKSLALGEALLVKSRANRFYLSGFDTSAGAVVITRGNAYFLTDSRYIEEAKRRVCHIDVKCLLSFKGDIGGILKKEDIKTLYFETEQESLKIFLNYKEMFEGVKISDSDKFDTMLKELRSIKDKYELKSIRAAQEITDSAFDFILEHITIGRTEREIMLDLEFFMRKNGSEGVAFDTIVVSGKNSSMPHGVPSDKKTEKGDFITMDFGARVNGYCSDMTRTVAIGNISDKQALVYDTVLKAQKAALKAIKSGAVCKSIDKIARDIIDNAGYKGLFGHGLGHSVGIEIHESPSFNTSCKTPLSSGTVMTVEPGIYLENEFGVRIEDMVFVTEKGTENITKSKKELIIL